MARGNKALHVALVAGWWLVLLRLVSWKTDSRFSALVWLSIVLAWVAFGAWRVVKKYRRRRHEAQTP